jgi:hypothetical protein
MKLALRLKRPNTSAQTDFLAKGCFFAATTGYSTYTENSSSLSELTSRLISTGDHADSVVGCFIGDYSVGLRQGKPL